MEASTNLKTLKVVVTVQLFLALNAEVSVDKSRFLQRKPFDIKARRMYYDQLDQPQTNEFQ